MITSMSNEGEETLTYEPTSFVAQRPNVNPDSPRHFKSKRRRNNAKPKLKRRPQSMIDFGAMNHKKEQSRDRVAYKRSKTLIERCRGALYRTISMDILLGSASPSEDDKSVEEGTNSLNFSKPITSRFKVQEIRKVNSGKSDRHYGKPSLTRSKSDGSCPSNTEFTAERRSSRQCHSVLLKVRNCDYADENGLKDRVIFDDYNSTNSLDSIKTKSGSSTTSSPSSGFCDFTGTESENDNLSSDCSSVVTRELSFQGKTSPSLDITFDQDKNAEEKQYSRSLENSRRPTSVVRSTSFGHKNRNSANEPMSAPASLISSVASSLASDDVFSIDDIDGSIVEIKHPKGTSDNKISTSPRRTNKSYKNKNKQTNRKTRPKSCMDFRSDTAKHHQERPRSMCEQRTGRVAKLAKKSQKQDKTYLSIEQCIERLSISPPQTLERDTNKSRNNSAEKRRTMVNLPVGKGKNIFSYVSNIRIESVV